AAVRAGHRGATLDQLDRREAGAAGDVDGRDRRLLPQQRLQGADDRLAVIGEVQAVLPELRDVHGYSAAFACTISALCWPSPGAARCTGGRLPSNLIGKVIRLTSRPGIGCSMPVAAVCGCASTSATLLIGAQGTSTADRMSTHSPLVRVSSTAWISASSQS